VRAEEVRRLALDCGFELAGIAAAERLPEAEWYAEWVHRGMAGDMRYLTDHRASLRADPRALLPSARSILCVGKLYNGPEPYSTQFEAPARAWISRYAWGQDYHGLIRRGLRRVVQRLQSAIGRPFQWKICVDSAPLLERAYARSAGLGWIGRNTCLIREGAGSWFFLGELLLSLELEPDRQPPDRCGTCMRCIEACPTQAIVPTGRAEPAWALDARRCISYLTIELRSEAPPQQRAGIGRHVFGCDICQEVCPWNGKAPATLEPAFAARFFAPPLEQLAALTEQEFNALFRGTPVLRSGYAGFLRNVAIAMGNSGLERFRPLLERLASHPDPLVGPHAEWALARLPPR
jgi:epoxyqueuosine reductase